MDNQELKTELIKRTTNGNNNSNNHTRNSNKNKKRHKNKKWTFLRVVKILFWCFFCYFLFSIAITVVYKWVNPPITILMVQRCVEQSFSSEREVRIQKHWVNYEDISSNMITAVIASEDNNFPRHRGFDFHAIERARKINYRRGKKAFGASTISQQTAKNTFLWIQKSYIRKGLEAWYTTLEEIIWGKKRIMEVYLNVIEFGDGIYGVEAASEYYFGKSANKLTKRESSLLASILPSPLKRSASNPSPYVKRRATIIQRKMNIIGRVRLK